MFKKYSSLLAAAFFLLILPDLRAQIAVFNSPQPLEIAAEGDTTLCFGFAEGDEIILNVEELKGRKLQEVSVSEYPDFEKFAEEKVSKISDARIKVYKTAVYCFRFSNGPGSKSKSCTIQIQRVPASTAKNDFVTAVKWVEVMDTVVSAPSAEADGARGDSMRQFLAVLVDTSLLIQPAKKQLAPLPRLSFEIPAKKYSFDRIKFRHSIEPSACVFSIDVGNAGDAWFAEANDKAAQAPLPRSRMSREIMESNSGKYDALLLMGLSGESVFPVMENADSICYFFNNDSYGNFPRLEKTCSAKSGLLPLINTKKQYLFIENRYSTYPLEVHVRVLAILLEKSQGKENPATEIETVRTRRIVKKRIPVLSGH